MYKQLLIALALFAAVAYFAQIETEQRELADKLIRLHVVGASDSAADQNYKLEVRDAVIGLLRPILSGAADAAEAEALLGENLQALEALAPGLSATLETESFPERDYETFSLPAGEYRTLRVEIGAAEGKNWWCVMFPPLCYEAASGESDGEVQAAFARLTGGEIDLITGKSGYVVKFRVLDVIAKLKAYFRR
ncbi:MAG: stage II sporulation protein R [Oscillospiraceae bacterium]|jgi:stage II sporulation protein R|nr:stage II sporulation protein R [Oscillospiraceae bacterium]